MEDFLSQDVNAQAEQQFEKLFEFESSENWRLPASDQLNKEKTWDIETLKKFKSDLNATKSLLNDKGVSWQKHTENIDKAQLVRDCVKKLVKPEFLTRAWCKFYEIAVSFPVVNSDVDVFRSFHMCEAPGAFISALNYHLCLNHSGLKWEWFANSLNPYYEGESIQSTVVDDRLIFNTLKRWHFGEDKTGDILSPTYLQDISEFLSAKGPIHLVTADGSINCLTNPGEQELTVSPLQFQEIAIALNILCPGGNLILKKFTFFECASVCAMYLLNCCFEKVHVFKPATSKSGNSEVYVICLGYKAADFIKDYLTAFQQFLYTKDLALFSQKDMMPDFIDQLEKCCLYFMKFQTDSIKENLMLYDDMTSECEIHVNDVKEACVTHYVDKYSLQPLHANSYRRLYALKKKSIKTSFGDITAELKYTYSGVFGETFEAIKETESLSWGQYLLNVESRLNMCHPVNRKRPQKRAAWFPIWMEVMRSAKKSSYMDWISMGKKVHSLLNSKFCNPFLLLLWNEVINGKIKSLPEYHKATSYQDWDWNPFIDLLEKRNELLKTTVIVNLEVDDRCCNNVLSGLKQAMGEHLQTYSCCLSGLEKYTSTCKTVVFDSTLLNTKTFDTELATKYNFVKTLASIVNVLEVGDSLVLVLSSLLTRFTVGILFSLLSLFKHTTTVLPLDTAPSLTGQIWILANLQSPAWTGQMLEYFEHISNHEETETNSILEVVPITELCCGQFYEHLLNINQQCMLQRLRKLIKMEKSYRKKDNDYK